MEMKTLQEHLEQCIITEKFHPLIKKEIKTKNNEFNEGDIVLFREMYEKGDETSIMIVVENLGDRCKVKIISSPLSKILGFSTQTYSCKDLFKVGEVNFKVEKHNFDVKGFLEYCDSIGIDTKETKERLKYYGYI